MPIKAEDDSKISAFERKRLANIQANREVLTDISATAKRVIPEKPSPKPSTRKPARRKEPVKRETARPTRSSSRLAGLQADDATLKRKMEVEAESQAEAAKAKKMRVSGDLNLGDIVVEGKKWGSGVDGIKGLLVRGAQPGVRTFTEDDVKETTDKELKGLRQRMGGLKLYEHWAPNDIKLTPQRVYALGFHPTEDKPIIFAGDKEGAMGVFDGSQTPPEVDDDDEDADYPDPVISAFKIHARTITSFVFPPEDANAVYTSSYDSSIRKMDLDKGTSVQIFAPSDPDVDLPISALDMPHSEPHMLYFSTLDGCVGRYDTRAPGSEEIWSLSTHKIGGFSLHPLQPHLIATASLDRTLKIWDCRKITGGGDLRHPALLGEHESRLSVSHASWSAGGHVATSSYDDTVKIYDFSDAGSWEPGHDIGTKAMEPKHQVRHNNQTGRWVTILKPQWQRRPRDGIQKLVIGNMNRFVDVFASDGSQLAQLGGDGITAVPAVAHFHPSMDWVAGANSSGKLCLWQ
ncbi:WD repeat-containing protein /-like protein [Hapsidospora chrysogenum ATCC 11550]|uniref:DNA damage-binding protein CMR1 n=1 Tax=Hapsidospora chrysogenum (strain ATCC 11550 / CBS 779.69 / DSM 880 / IAM 14645 / JCM 23072 / IMI 49137) TaxID=857340 RepID=A0A086T8H5_HAPC1|nr:WD repeat-containing protein /-like protein [Hapsidospora chrysogenum ATCC 11550]